MICASAQRGGQRKGAKGVANEIYLRSRLLVPAEKKPHALINHESSHFARYECDSVIETETRASQRPGSSGVGLDEHDNPTPSSNTLGGRQLSSHLRPSRRHLVIQYSLHSLRCLPSTEKGPGKSDEHLVLSVPKRSANSKRTRSTLIMILPAAGPADAARCTRHALVGRANPGLADFLRAPCGSCISNLERPREGPARGSGAQNTQRGTLEAHLPECKSRRRRGRPLRDDDRPPDCLSKKGDTRKRAARLGLCREKSPTVLPAEKAQRRRRKGAACEVGVGRESAAKRVR